MLSIKLVNSTREPTHTASHNTGAVSLGLKQYADGHLGFAIGDAIHKAFFYSEDDVYSALEGHDLNVSVGRFRFRDSDCEYCDVTVNGITCSVREQLLEQYIKVNPDIVEENKIKFIVVK